MTTRNKIADQPSKDGTENTPVIVAIGASAAAYKPSKASSAEFLKVRSLRHDADAEQSWRRPRKRGD